MVNTQKAIYNSNSFIDLATLLDLYTPDILLLMETPMHPHQGALTQVLRNMVYKTHYNLVNSPSPQGTLPEARLPIQIIHNGVGCWMALKKQAPWAATIRNLPLPGPCPNATTCAVELTLHSAAKAANIACYLPQAVDDHS